MTVYKYDAQTKEFIQELEINEAYGTNLPFTTTIKPLVKKDGFAICFNGTKWEYIEDNRNTAVYNKETKKESKIDYLGKIKDDVTTSKPEQFDKWDYDSDKWVEDVIEIEKQRISSIKAKANELIEMIYPIYKQNNILMSQITEDIKGMNAYILNIRNISNEAEANGTLLQDIVWN